MNEIDAEFSAPLQCLFVPKRYKVLWGGRAAGRSWGIARGLLLMAAQKTIRVLCARELQNSILESVHKVISDQITLLGLDDKFEIQKDRIIGVNGSIFIFAGIKNNINKIKSFEGIDYCWVEEANKVSRHSWGVLLPTVRKTGSEIWISFNPELETDYTYSRFVKNSELQLANPAQFSVPCPNVLESSDSFVVKMTYKDNKWLSDTTKVELENDRKRDPDFFANVWEGNTVQSLEGAVYAKELREAQSDGRICTVPWHRETPVDTFWDLGRADATAIWFAQRVAMQYRVLAYYSASGQDITFFLKELQRRSYVYGTHHLPHDAAAKRLGSKKTIEEMVRAVYPKGVRIVPKQSLTDGVNAARLVFPNCWFDEDECEEGLQALRHYHYKVKDGQRSQEPVHDWASDGSDAFRYMALSWRGPNTTGKTVGAKLDAMIAKVRESTGAGLGWMGN